MSSPQMFTERADHSVIREFRMLLMTSIWLFCCIQYFVPFLFILPIALIPRVGIQLYRMLHNLYDPFGVVITMTVPFSWCGLQVRIKGYDAFRLLKDDPDALILSTHCGRIDWLMGTYLAVLGDLRVGFVAEATTALMPIIGWQRWLAGDIFVMRAFHKDQPMIEANIASFKASGIRRALFLAPEGFVADPGTKVCETYLPACDEFMRKEGREPLTHLLTPRYKGTSVFVKHAPQNIISCAMSYVEDAVFNSAHELVGGYLMSRGLRDPRRTIPDLHSVFRGGMGVVIQGGHLAIEADDAQKLKGTMLDDQSFKDRMLRQLEATGGFLGDDVTKSYYVRPQSPPEPIKAPHFFLNFYFVAHTIVSACAIMLTFNMSFLEACGRMAATIVAIFVLHGGTHYFARWSTGTESTESLCGETAIKALIGFIMRVVKQVGAGKKSRTPRSKAE